MNKDMRFTSQSEQDTIRIAENLAPDLGPQDVVLLSGDLGAGKSVFARALIRHIIGNPQADVPSPTFTLVQSYETPNGEVWHFDLYRLEEAEEIYELGWEDALGHALLLIEWPERLGPLKPRHAVEVTFHLHKDGTRNIDIQDGRI